MNPFFSTTGKGSGNAAPLILLCKLYIVGQNLVGLVLSHDGHRCHADKVLVLAGRCLFVAPHIVGDLSALSGLFLAIHFVLWFESLAHTTVASSTTIVCTEVIWVALGFCLVLKGKLSWKAVGAIGVTLLGSVLIAWSDSGSGAQLYGDILALLAAIAVAVYMLLGRAVQKRLPTAVYTYTVYAACLAALLAVCAIYGFSLLSGGITTLAVGLALAVCSTILGHSIFSWCLKYFQPSFVSASKLCEPVVAAIIAAVLFREIPGIWQILGGVILIAIGLEIFITGVF